MAESLIEFASSSNGDRWLLGRDEATGDAFVVHEANQPSGGAVTRTTVRDFLSAGRVAPEHQALLRFTQTLRESAEAQSVDFNHLRQASENEVSKALEDAKVGLPLTTEYEALEFFNCMLDVLTEKDEADQGTRIAAGFGSTH